MFVYFKRRKPSELQVLENTLIERKINYKVFDYVKRYEEEDYLEYLKKAKYGIILDAHESQGFAIEEAMSCNVPLLVWNATSMAQEDGINYPPYPAKLISPKSGSSLSAGTTSVELSWEGSDPDG